MNEDRETLARIKRDWDRRAKRDARYYIAKRDSASEIAFRSSALRDLNALLSDVTGIGHHSVALEIGCGIGRLLKPLVDRVKEAHGVDASGEMIALARDYLRGVDRVHVYENGGTSLDQFGDETFDFVFSYITFQHIPERRIIESYVRESRRVLKPKGLFKFQVDGRGGSLVWSLWRTFTRRTTWRGIMFTPEQIQKLARDAGFEVLTCSYDPSRSGLRRRQYLWVVCRKDAPDRPR
jgi:SAM-dependent methyltransferase